MKKNIFYFLCLILITNNISFATPPQQPKKEPKKTAKETTKETNREVTSSNKKPTKPDKKAKQAPAKEEEVVLPEAEASPEPDTFQSEEFPE